MGTSYNKKIYLFLIIILLIGIITGFLIVKKLDKDLIINLTDNIKNIFLTDRIVKINNILSHIAILSIIILLSFIFIGLPIAVIYIFYNGICIGFILKMFYSIWQIKGSIYGLVFILITKLIFIFLLLIIATTVIKFCFALIKNIFNKNKSKISNLYILFRKMLLCFFMVMINDILLYIFANDILKLFNFLIN